MDEVNRAMAVALAHSRQVLLMQCNTEYTAKVGETRAEQLARFGHINLRVLETYANRWPEVPLGLSDHTHGDMTVLGAVGLFGCCAVEKHFTFDNTIEGQDHAFSMTPASWSVMVKRTAELQRRLAAEPSPSLEHRLDIVTSMVDDPEAMRLAIGDGVKRLEANETGTVVVQRRAVRASRDLPAGHRITAADLTVLRPCPSDALPPYRALELLGRVLVRDITEGDCIRPGDCQ
jgi:N-acetylneuraminate synthase